MLQKLFGSKARVSLLKLFLLNSEEKYYVRELSRRSGLAVNSIARELDNLEAFGLLNSCMEIVEIPVKKENAGEAAGGQAVDGLKKKSAYRPTGFLKQQRKYYRANRDFILLSELKNLIIRSQVLYEKDFATKIRRIGNLKLLILSGIFAGNEAGPVDILVVGKINKVKFSLLIKDMEKELQKELNFTVMDPDEYRYRKDMTDVFLYSILEGKKIVLIDEIGLL
ncbi:MAG: hypothetical protein WCW25_02615 [Patescibacteria group bacterium]|jgi:hypothetical protein